MSRRLATALAASNVVLGVAALVVVLVTAGWARSAEGGAPVVVQLVPMIVGFGFVGSFLLHRQPDNRVGWILAAVGALESIGTIAEASGAALLGDGQSVRVALTLALVGRVSQDFVIVFAAVLLPALFPSGEVPSPRWRWLPPTAVLVGVVSAVSLFVLPDELDLAGAEYRNPCSPECGRPWTAVSTGRGTTQRARSRSSAGPCATRSVAMRSSKGCVAPRSAR